MIGDSRIWCPQSTLAQRADDLVDSIDTYKPQDALDGLCAVAGALDALVQVIDAVCPRRAAQQRGDHGHEHGRAVLDLAFDGAQHLDGSSVQPRRGVRRLVDQTGNQIAAEQHRTHVAGVGIQRKCPLEDLEARELLVVGRSLGEVDLWTD